MLRLGSRLKTPVYPIWVCIATDNTGVLFSTDRELMRDYRAENHFQLHYYTSSHHQTSAVVLAVNTKTKDPNDEDATGLPLLEKIIRTK